MTEIGQILKLLILILGEYFAARKRAREANEKFSLDEAMMREIVARAVEKLLSNAKKESEQAGDVEDRIDRDSQATTSKQE